MKAFTTGLLKTAAIGDLVGKGLNIAKQVGKGTLEAGKAFGRGTVQSGGQTIGNVLKGKEFSHITKGIESAGGLKKAITTAEGRKTFAEGLGKAAPSLAAGGAALMGAKKVYDKTLGTREADPNYAYYQGG